METQAKDSTPVETLETPSLGTGDSCTQEKVVRFSGSTEVYTKSGLGLENTENGDRISVNVVVIDGGENDSAQVEEGKTPQEEKGVGVPVEEVVLVKTRVEAEASEIVIEGDNDNGATVSAEDMMLCENGKDHVDVKVKDSSFAERGLEEVSGVESAEINAPVEDVVSVLEDNKRELIGDIVGTRATIEDDTVVETNVVGASEGSELPAQETIDLLVGSSLMMDRSLKQDMSSRSNDDALGAQLNSENIVKVMKTGVRLAESEKSSEMEDKDTGVLETYGVGENSNTKTNATDADASMNATEEKEEGKEEKKEEEEDTDAQEYQLSVGDFVWGKIKSHPWWPGQVYDPSDASEYAGKYCRRDRLLVAYFGDGTFAWCDSSQLMPFSKDFEKMSKQSNSKSFLNAVEEALNEFGGCVLSEMTMCASEESRSSFARPLAVNAGIRTGVTVPEGRIGEFSVNEFEPEKFLVCLRGIAQGFSIRNMLEFTVLKIRLLAFYLAKGYNQLPMYHQPQGVPGLENQRKYYIPNQTNSDGQIDGVTLNPSEEVLLSSPVSPGGGRNTRNTSQKRPSISEDKLNQRKKQRSMAELMADNVESELENGGSEVAEKGTDRSNPAIPSRKQKKARLLVSPLAIPVKNGNDGKNNSAAATKSTSSSKKKKRTEDFSTPVTAEKAEAFDDANEDVGGEEGTVLSSPRQRKRSKYLSYPYTIPSGSKSTLSPKDVETETSPKVSWVGESVSRIAGQLTGAPPILKCSGETFQKKIPKEARAEQKTFGSASPRTPKANQEKLPVKVSNVYADEMLPEANEKKLPFKDSNVSADEMLTEFCSVAVNPLHLKDSHTPNTVRAFFTRFRSSLYRNGSDFESYKKNLDRSGSKGRKSSATAHSSLGKVTSDGTDLSVGKSGRKKRSSSEIECKPSGKDSRSEISLSQGKPGRKKKNSSLIDLNSSGRDSSGEINLSKGKSGRKKRNSSVIEPPSSGKDSRAETDLSAGKPGRRQKARDAASPLSPQKKSTDSLKHNVRSSGGKINNKEASAESAAALLLTFAQGSALPSKDDLIKAFSKFGVLNELETEVLEDSRCAQVVFARSSDAESAFSNSEKIHGLGPAVLSCRLRYLSAPRTLENDGNVSHPSARGDGAKGLPHSSGPAASSTPLLFIKHNLETMMLKLAESEETQPASEAEKLSPEVRANLAGEVGGLLEKVNALVEGFSC